MGQQIHTFNIEEGLVKMSGLGSLKGFLNFSTGDIKKFYGAVELAEDLLDDKGAALYTKGMKITTSEIKTLEKLQEKYSPKFQYKFILKPNQKVIAYFRQNILRLLDRLIEHREKYRVYSHLFGPFKKQMKQAFQEALEDDLVALHVYKMKFASDHASTKLARPYFHHVLSVALFSYCIANIDALKQQIHFSDEDDRDLIRAALLYAIGGLSHVDGLIGLPIEHRQEGFNEENKKSLDQIASCELSQNVQDAIIFANEYVYGCFDIVNMKEVSTWMANIIITAHMYTVSETGIFGEKTKLKEIVDHQNVMAINKKLNMEVIQAFTLGLKMLDVFDFYQEIDELMRICDENCAVPYPMTGLASPTLFLCNALRKGCEFAESGTKAVTLVQAVGVLEPGGYYRCAKASPRLQKFYETHYHKIKKDEKVEQIS